MISLLLKIIFIFYFIMTILEIRNIHIYNLNSNLLILKDDINRINVNIEIENLSPILLKNIYNDNIDNDNLIIKNPGYMIQDRSKFISLKELKENYNIYENYKIVSDLYINTEKIFDLFENKMTTNKKSNLSLFGSNVQSVLSKCVNNMTCFTSSQNITFYLFNPKHFHDIFGKDLNKIKKWAIKTEIAKGDVLYIPCEWNYIYEGKGNLLKTTMDNYFSIGYNFIRE